MWKLSFLAVALAVFATVNSFRCARTTCQSRQLHRYTTALNMAKIALTREDGANDKLASLLKGCDVVEIPCIMFSAGEDTDKLPGALKDHDIIVITSPQAATVFLDAWAKAGKPDSLKIATVGKGTSKPLKAAGIVPVFEPSDATAETLAAEMPSSLGSSVLYPSSAIAENTLAQGLEKRGFKVTRLNTYTTVPAIWSKEQEKLAKEVDIVTFGSPSAVKTWAEKAGTKYTAVVIGPTSAKAATTQGYQRIVAPEGGSKGLEAWADTIKKVALEMEGAKQ
jgi:uroporphyrinogen-III synthase